MQGDPTQTPAETGYTGPGHTLPNDIRLTFPGSALSVRRALEGLMLALAPLKLDPEEAGTVELVLAEALNNVAEHAYPETEDGWINLECSHHANGLHFRIRDEGREMPEGRAPLGTRAPLPEELDALPEGGFGWFLIRDLSHDVEYSRDAGVNLLSFRIKVAYTEDRN